MVLLVLLNLDQRARVAPQAMVVEVQAEAPPAVVDLLAAIRAAVGRGCHHQNQILVQVAVVAAVAVVLAAVTAVQETLQGL